MPSSLSILCFGEPHDEDLKVFKMANFLGLPCEIFSLQSDKDFIKIIDKKNGEIDQCIAIRCDTLFTVFSNKQNFNKNKQILSIVSYLFIYDCKPGESSSCIMPLMTSGLLKSVRLKLVSRTW